MTEAKELEVTPADIEVLTEEVGMILYAEWAEPGAMGCSGSARIYKLRGNELIRYIARYPDYYALSDVYTSVNYLSKTRLIADSPSEDILKKLNGAVNAGKIPKPCFQSVRGGFGNYAWINIGAGLAFDDDSMGLVYRFNGRAFLIECSVPAVYERVRSQLCRKIRSSSNSAMANRDGDPLVFDLDLSDPEDFQADVLSDLDDEI